MRDTALEVENGKTIVQMKNPNDTSFQLAENGTVIKDYHDSDLYFVNEHGEKQLYHFEYLQWKWPAEHTIENTHYEAELQIYHTQRATNNEVALSILFSTALAANKSDRAKTCFVDSFDFLQVKQAVNEQGVKVLEVPLREFIQYVPQNKMIFYKGSHTTPDCDPSVIWLVNTQPFEITEAQLESLKVLYSQETQDAGGANRDIQDLDGRNVYKFDNYKNKDRALNIGLSAATNNFAISLVALAVYALTFIA